MPLCPAKTRQKIRTYALAPIISKLLKIRNSSVHLIAHEDLLQVPYRSPAAT